MILNDFNYALTDQYRGAYIYTNNFGLISLIRVLGKFNQFTYDPLTYIYIWLLFTL